MELEHQVEELYASYLASKLQPEQTPGSTLVRILQRLTGSRVGVEKTTPDQILEQITKLVRGKPGRYPLAEIAYKPTPPFWHSGFTYGFIYHLGSDQLVVDYWSYNHWGIFVQKTPKDSTPEIEIYERTLELDEELDVFDKEGSKIKSYTERKRLLHLPEGFKIPVGPLHFEEDSLPVGEKELVADKARAINAAKAAGLRVNKDILDIAEGLFKPARMYPDRYFYWQPVLTETPTNIGIDFDNIRPYHMGLTLEGAPTFDDTIIIEDEF